MRIHLYIFLLITISVTKTYSQKTIASVHVPEWKWAGLHPSGEFYILHNFTLTQYNANGATLNQLTLNKNTLSDFDAWHLTQFMLYEPAERKVHFYNPQLEYKQFFYIDSVFAIDPVHVTGAFDQKSIWILDAADNSLKKVNTRIGEVTIDVPMPGLKANEIQTIREYQQFLFLISTQQVVILNGVGKKIKTIPLLANQQIEFFGEELVLYSGNELLLIDLFSNEKRKIILPAAFSKILLAEDRLIGFRGDHCTIYEYKMPD
jgi:hypothetical protein